MQRPNVVWAVGPLACTALVLTGCSGSSADGAGSSAVPSPSTSSASGTSAPTGSAPGGHTSESPSPAPGENLTFHGTILGSGLTCVPFTDSHGKRYALTGPGVSTQVRALAHSGFRRKSLKASPNQRMVGKVTVVGHVESHAMNTCSYTTLVTSKVTILSTRAVTGGSPAVGA